MNGLDTSRIDHIISQAWTGEAIVTVVGLGSGGAPVARMLAMTGIRHWNLFDPDVLEPVNLVKHPALRSELGMPKVEIEARWIRDRLPDAQVNAYQQDVIGSPDFITAVAGSDLVINAVDHRGAREFVNDMCVRFKVPMVVGSVYRGGFGGEIYAYVPGWSACLHCMEDYSAAHNMNIQDQQGFSDQEQEMVYGQGIRDFRLSGLAIDIATITSLHAQMALTVLFGARDRTLKPPGFNWVIFGNRPNEFTGGTHFTVKRLFLKPKRDCICHLNQDAGLPFQDAGTELIQHFSPHRAERFGDLMQPVFTWKYRALQTTQVEK